MVIRCGLIGVGSWGQKYIDAISKRTDIKLVALSRNKPIKPEMLKDCVFYEDWHNLIKNGGCQAIIVCTPPETHLKIATEIIKNKIPVLIEKPVTLSLEDTIELFEIDLQAIILVNNIHLFSPAYEKLLTIVPQLGKIKSIVSSGYNYGPFRTYSSLYDYGPHDIGMCLQLIGDCCSVVDVSNISTNKSELYDFILKFGDIPVSIRVGNGATDKSRYFEVHCENGTIIYDNLANEKLTLNNVPIEVDIRSPLDCVLDKFIASCTGYLDHRFGKSINIDIMRVLKDIEEKS
jgi:predicted dehydrogenase